ncbi:unnamed protein product [Ilex paraguariensis]|uniref:Non-haem dioxygenase N-terminal domain-containing protein n=1 Tax=Ilex paraguariensis TaxID=185542 RepID=A0ABC8T8K0_9AQUA
MVVTACAQSPPAVMSNYDRKSELKAFDDSKAGVKGLVDAGVATIPRIFLGHDQIKHDVKLHSSGDSQQYGIPVIDVTGIHEDPGRRAYIADKVRNACEKWGFFQLINHGVPASVMNGMIDGVRRFHEQDTEVKKQFYSRDVTRRFTYNSNFDLYQAPAASWRDTFYCVMAPHRPDREELPAVCRYVLGF